MRGPDLITSGIDPEMQWYKHAFIEGLQEYKTLHVAFKNTLFVAISDRLSAHIERKLCRNPGPNVLTGSFFRAHNTVLKMLNSE